MAVTWFLLEFVGNFSMVFFFSPTLALYQILGEELHTLKDTVLQTQGSKQPVLYLF